MSDTLLTIYALIAALVAIKSLAKFFVYLGDDGRSRAWMIPFLPVAAVAALLWPLFVGLAVLIVIVRAA